MEENSKKISPTTLYDAFVLEGNQDQADILEKYGLTHLTKKDFIDYLNGELERTTEIDEAARKIIGIRTDKGQGPFPWPDDEILPYLKDYDKSHFHAW